MGNACFRNATFTPTTYLHSARMKKAAPLPPSKVTTPLSLSLSDLQRPPPQPPGSRPPSLQSLHHAVPASLLKDQGDECAINELLEGRMDLDVVLPDARKVRMNVERRTPMMDLLVQVTTAHKVNPGGHVIHIPTDRGRDYLSYKPSTPIGSLDTNSIHIVPKSVLYDPPVKRMPKMANKPFEQTFRLQVNLPRNQLMVLRVGPRTTLGEVKLLACKEKNMDPSRYMLAHPQRPDALLDLNGSMANYGATEITLLSNSNFNANVCNSTSDIIMYAREDSQKKKGILGLFSRKKSKGSVVDSSSDSLDSRGVSPSRSDGSGPRNSCAKVSIKKRPAPPPPAKPTNQSTETIPAIPTTTTTILPPIIDEQPIMKLDGNTVSHSRHSSDSSGYHEASLLSESPDNHSPDVCSGSGSSGLSMDSGSQPVKSRRKTSTPTRPTQLKDKPIMTTSLSDTQLLVTAANRKRRAPPPPPVLRSDSEPTKISSSPSEVMETIILEEPMVEPEEVDQGVELKTSSPEPTCSPPVSEVENCLMEDREKRHLTESPTEGHSPPASPHTDSGLAMEDDTDLEEMDYPYQKGSKQEEEDNWSLGERGPLITPPSPFINPMLTGVQHTIPLHEAIPVSAFQSRARFFTSLHHWAGSNNSTTEGIGRRSSLTSLGTIDDVQNSFDLTIAEAQKVLDDEEKRLSLSSEGFLEEPDEEDSPVVVEVTQRQILSRIEAAFSAVEQEEEEISKPISAIPKDDDLGWDYTIPEPPPAFRNNNALQEAGSKPHTSSQSSVSSDGIPPPLPTLPPPMKDSSQPKKHSIKELTPIPSVQHSSPPPSAKPLPPPPVKVSILHCVKEPIPPLAINDPQPISLLKKTPSVKESTPVIQDPEEAVESRDTVESRLQAPRTRRPPLLNFTIGTYRKPKEDIFSAFDVANAKDVPNSAPVILGEPLSVPVISSTSADILETPLKNNKMVHVYGMEGSVRGIKGHVRLCCAEMVDTVGPALVARSASMLSLTPTSRKIEVDGKVKNVQRTNSTVTDNLRKAQSVQDLNSDDSDANLEQEQERLQQEYSKLHQQFLVWNQQLQDNQSLLEKQKIVSVSTLLPPMPVKEPEKVVINGRTALNSIGDVAEEVAARSQTLPRTRPKPVVEVPVEEKRTFTLERRPKSQILANVTIGSWQQRKSNENINVLPPTDNMQFHSLDSSNAVVPEQKRNGHHPSTKPPVSKRPVSMYASWQKPPVDEPDKIKPKFDIQFSSNQSSQSNSLRMSNTKTYFKPPEVKSTSFSRQRIPPEDIQPPSKDSGPISGSWKAQPKDSNVVRDNGVSKKFVFGQKEPNGTHGGGKTVTYLNGDKTNSESNIKTVQINGKLPNSNGLAQRPSFSIKSVPKVVGFRANGSSEPSPTNLNPPPPPPPPPPPQVPIKAQSVATPPPKPQQQWQQSATRSAKSAQLLSAPKLDPREELMLEIRNFGGRKTLRKVPVSQINWQLKVHGSNSTLTA